METSIHYVEKVDFGNVRKQVIGTEGVFYTRKINIQSNDETLTVIMFSDSLDNLVQKRGGKDENS